MLAAPWASGSVWVAALQTCWCAPRGGSSVGTRGTPHGRGVPCSSPFSVLRGFCGEPTLEGFQGPSQHTGGLRELSHLSVFYTSRSPGLAHAPLPQLFRKQEMPWGLSFGMTHEVGTRTSLTVVGHLGPKRKRTLQERSPVGRLGRQTSVSPKLFSLSQETCPPAVCTQGPVRSIPSSVLAVLRARS